MAATSAASSTSLTSESDKSASQFSIHRLIPSDALADYAVVKSVRDEGPPSMPTVPGGHFHVQPMPLGVRQYYAKRTITLSRAIRKSLRAEDRVATKRGNERTAYYRALQYQRSSQRDAQQQANYALAMSRAVIETLTAEKRLASRLIREAEIYTRSTNEMADAVDDRVALAAQQLHNLLQQAQSSGIPEEHLAFDTQPRSDPGLRLHPSNAANDHAAKDFESDSSDSNFSEEADEERSLSGESNSHRSHSNGSGSDMSTRHHVPERDGDTGCLQPETGEDGDTSDSQSFYDVESGGSLLLDRI